MSPDNSRKVLTMWLLAYPETADLDIDSVRRHVSAVLGEMPYRDVLVSEIDALAEKAADYAAEIKQLKARADWLEAQG